MEQTKTKEDSIRFIRETPLEGIDRISYDFCEGDKIRLCKDGEIRLKLIEYDIGYNIRSVNKRGGDCNKGSVFYLVYDKEDPVSDKENLVFDRDAKGKGHFLIKCTGDFRSAYSIDSILEPDTPIPEVKEECKRILERRVKDYLIERVKR